MPGCIAVVGSMANVGPDENDGGDEVMCDVDGVGPEFFFMQTERTRGACRMSMSTST